jgi:hypothetical protein
MSDEPRPDEYEAKGIVRIAGLAVSLEDQGGIRWPLSALLQELAGRAVHIRVEPIAVVQEARQ